MAQNYYQRNTIFLYPNLEKVSDNERKQTLRLISRISAIKDVANRELIELVDGGSFSFVNCLPKVQMECVSDISLQPLEADNVRICITKFDGNDYTGNYDELIRQYKSGKSKISHLVALNISDSFRKIEFSKDEESKFDVIISTSFDNLVTALVSIMFDISLYHYFGLSDNLADRKKFNDIKFDYLKNNLSEKEQEDYFGNKLPDETIYLPISIPEVKKIGRRYKSKTRQDAVNEMLESYATFLEKSSMAVVIKKDKDGDLLNSRIIPSDIIDIVREITHTHKDLREYVVVLFKNSINNFEYNVVKYTKKKKVPCWVKNTCEGLTFYKIISVKQEG